MLSCFYSRHSGVVSWFLDPYAMRMPCLNLFASKNDGLKRYAQPVLARDLKEEGVYFLFNYMNDDLVVPKMETVVFIGRNPDAGDEDQVYFQDIRSYRGGIRYDSEEWKTVSCMSENETNERFRVRGGSRRRAEM